LITKYLRRYTGRCLNIYFHAPVCCFIRTSSTLLPVFAGYPLPHWAKFCSCLPRACFGSRSGLIRKGPAAAYKPSLSIRSKIKRWIKKETKHSALIAGFKPRGDNSCKGCQFAIPIRELNHLDTFLPECTEAACADAG
jgi:hypothetical protein